jgi:hypothetical protein
LAPPEEDAVPVTFRVYTPNDIKSKRFFKAPASIPAPDPGLRDVREALAVAQELGPRALVTRLVVGGLVGAIVLASVMWFVGSDDTSDHADGRALASLVDLAPPPATSLLPAVAAPTTAAAPATTAMMGVPVHVYSTDDGTIELPATPPPSGSGARRVARAAKKADANHGTIVRVSPF